MASDEGSGSRSTDSGWRVVGNGLGSAAMAGGRQEGERSSHMSSMNPSAQHAARAMSTSSHGVAWPPVTSAPPRSGSATPWSGHATPQSGYASPRSGYASPRITPQRGRAPPAFVLSQKGAHPVPPSSSHSKRGSQRTAVDARAGAAISRASTPGLKRPTKEVPIDVVIEILRQYARLSPSCALNALLISKALSPALEEAVYGSVSLFSASAMANFYELVKSKPEIGRRVKALWIAPGHLKSDLIPCLAPPTSNATNDARQRKVQGLARDILRACRRLDHLAMDGGFLTPQSAVAFGTACKPKTLLCVNPHSFLGHFSAPIFRTTVRRLEIVDTTLAVEEVDEIRQMQGLHAFVWTSPRANTDVTRDVSVLLRILSPRAADITAASSDISHDRDLLEILNASGNALPDRGRQNDKLRSICTATSHARAAALAASFKKVIESVTVRDDDDDFRGYGSHGDDSDDIDDISRAMRAVRAGGGVYVDSSMSHSSALHAPSGVHLQTEALSSLMHALAVAQKNPADPTRSRRAHDELLSSNGFGEHGDEQDYENNKAASDGDDDDESDDNDDDEVVEEWEALRDVVCQRRTANSTSSSRYFAGVGSGASGTHGMNGSGLLVRSTAPSARSATGSTMTSAAPSTVASGISTPAVGWASQAVSRAASRAASPSLGGPNTAANDEIDGGRALQRIWRRWRTQVNTGALEHFVC